jgi:hypothetical protein
LQQEVEEAVADGVAGGVERLVEVGDIEKGFCNPFAQV